MKVLSQFLTSPDLLAAYVLQPLDWELERQQQEVIIEPVQTNERATPLVVEIRVCGDYKVTVNRCVETKVYPLTTYLQG